MTKRIERIFTRYGVWLALGAGVGAACWAAPAPTPTAPVELTPAAQSESAKVATTPQQGVKSDDPARAKLIGWLGERKPAGGEIVDEPPAPVRIIHSAGPDDTYASIASSYVDLTEIYLAPDLNKAIHVKNALGNAVKPRPGDRIEIPSVLQRAPGAPEEERLAWPDDKALRGLYLRGPTAENPLYIGTLERMAKRGWNLIVLDAKDYDGLVTYRSKIPLVLETGAAKGATIRDLRRTIRFAHNYGVRVAMRVSCFEDEFIVRAKPSLSVMGKWKGPYKIGWMDPSNEGAQAYLLEMVAEVIDAGADEVELDYIRYPVLGIKDADFDLESRHLTKKVVIRDFVRRVHTLTQAHGVPLSLDIFGVVCDGKREDIEMLGQDPALLATECEALSPMVYPSHYRTGYQGFEIPGNHPEIVGIGTRKLLAQLAGIQKSAVVRPWLQAMDYHSPDYGPPYLAAEMKSAEQAGAAGWLMWNPGQSYTVAWEAVPPERAKAVASAERRDAGE